MKRKIVTLCGSTRFKDAFVEANMQETLAGNIVLSVGAYMHAEGVQTILAESRGFPLTQRGEAREAEFLERNGGYELLGAWGRYETMVFVAGEPCECGCGIPGTDGHDLDGERYDDAQVATRGHMYYCERAATGRIGFASSSPEESPHG